MALEDTPLTGDIPVLCITYAAHPRLERSDITVSYRFTGPDGHVDDERQRIDIRNPQGCKESREWLKAVLGELLLTL